LGCATASSLCGENGRPLLPAHRGRSCHAQAAEQVPLPPAPSHLALPVRQNLPLGCGLVVTTRAILLQNHFDVAHQEDPETLSCLWILGHFNHGMEGARCLCDHIMWLAWHAYNSERQLLATSMTPPVSDINSCGQCGSISLVPLQA
jgi:hypothetical protein